MTSLYIICLDFQWYFNFEELTGCEVNMLLLEMVFGDSNICVSQIKEMTRISKVIGPKGLVGRENGGEGLGGRRGIKVKGWD